jgi:circadian clock protein KaiC
MSTTNLLTAHLSTRSSHDQTFGIEEFLASGTFLLRVQRVGDKFQRSLAIRKMRGTPVLPGEFSFEINSAHGIVLQESAAPAAVEAAAAPMFEHFQLPPK